MSWDGLLMWVERWHWVTGRLIGGARHTVGSWGNKRPLLLWWVALVGWQSSTPNVSRSGSRVWWWVPRWVVVAGPSVLW